MSLRWWEKTVEYKFVVEVCGLKDLYLAPLDGDHERAGDTIFSTKNKWILIEFKKDKGAVSSEIGKFTLYESAKKALEGSDSHHHIIYGQKSLSSPPVLELCARTYFSNVTCSHKVVLSSGTDFPSFKVYVEKYIEFKKGPKGGGGSGISMDDFALVAGVNTSNEVVSCMSLSDFRKEIEPTPNMEKKIVKTMSRYM